VFFWRRQDDRLDSAFTRRTGGTSVGRFAGLNLAGHVGDAPDDVAANRALLAESLGIPVERLLFMNQCHGAEATFVEGSWAEGAAPSSDAMVTAQPGLALVVLVADCVPVLLADREHGVVAAVHAGRLGMVAGVVASAVEAMRDLGARDIEAAVGPSVCGRCYEVPADMRDTAAAVIPEARTVSWAGTPAIDVSAGVVAQLVDQGVGVRWVRGCTREEPDLYSYRRDGQTGRTAGVVMLRTA
jgi:purine-nucleoside/S-methyl-5'-thioadenosine phosphorylase / adenosine deaminase